MNHNDLYPLQQSDELICQISKSCEQLQQKEPDNQQHIVPEIQPFSIDDFKPIFNMDHPSSYSSANKTPKKDNPSSQRADESKKKMVVRRDVERQRRQEMANLHALLRSLLPLEYIKGKRSVSDHMNEATKYIKNLQKMIVEMKDKKDELNRLSINNSKSISVIPRLINSFSQPDFATVRPCVSGLEVVISSDGLLLPLSRVLRVLLEDGLLTVVGCVTTRVNEKSLHTIQIEVRDHTRINTAELQQKLIGLV
ncbi:transcription factor bHLH120-like [Papaver somniferum]|uniref:transcription factor bHLH120-like n=1 Tax=Papaver somniferum TaxID=3469 RepID=UPI000E7054E4|nr:transcription factor bHLH120-like [Papaver somniferum]